ncbi:MAG: efflux RND transporter periplasmic adaptor subunit [Verrucomicrobia bacterium]|nr:efflux RND transporter periplasmic adaptor subunit [Verrucomicrobiota bacterium]
MRTFFKLLLLLAVVGARGALAAEPVTASGILTPLEEIHIGSEMRGLILWMADEGEAVAKDAPLVKLRDNLERFELDLRKAQLESARCQVERYQLDYEATRKLQEQKIATDEDLRAKRLNYLQSAALVAQAEAQLKTTQENIEMKIIRAPIRCVVLKHMKKPGEVLVVTAGVENIMKVAHIDSLYMMAFPDAKYVAQVHTGQKAEVRIPLLGNRVVAGEVVYVDAVVDAASGGFRIKVLIANPKHEIKAGLQGTVTLLPDAPQAAAK